MQKNPTETGSLVDPVRSACLCDVGMPDHIAAVVIEADGTETLILVHRPSIGDSSVRYARDFSTIAPHELAGPLPRRWHDRAWLAPSRCGHPTKAGGRCRQPVRWPGTACRRHMDRSTA